MRLLFVSSTTVGGSGRSQRELTRQLERRGHQVKFLVDDGRPVRFTRAVYAQLSDLAARTANLPGGRAAAWFERLPGRRTRQIDFDGWIQESSPVPQNAADRLIDAFRPDAVVGNSLERLAWRRVHRVCARRGIPTVLYVREVDSLSHFAYGEVPDLLVANAESLQAALQQDGHECAFIPSVIDVEVTRTTSTRRVALAINPIASKGSDIVWEIASTAPEVPIVAQESWPLEGASLSDVERHADRLENVEFRRVLPPGPQLYNDTRVLLVPYRVDSRPRVIAEAQANGIPVIAGDVPALREAIGEGGIVVPLDDIQSWVAELRSLWTDQDRYERLAAEALAHSKRPAFAPESVAASFEALVGELVRRQRKARNSRCFPDHD